MEKIDFNDIVHEAVDKAITETLVYGVTLRVWFNVLKAADDYGLIDLKRLHETVNRIEANERPIGTWLHPSKTDIACECSVCHTQMPITKDFMFCPYCGARMVDKMVDK